MKSEGSGKTLPAFGGERCEKLSEVNLHRLRITQLGAQPLTPQLCTAATGNGEDGLPEIQDQNPESGAELASSVHSQTHWRWMNMARHKVQMRPNGIYVTESDGGRCSVTLAWANKGHGEKKIAGCEMESCCSQQVAELWLQPQIQFCSWGSRSGQRIFPHWEVLTRNTWAVPCVILARTSALPRVHGSVRLPQGVFL